jgi:hypothetical protein
VAQLLKIAAPLADHLLDRRVRIELLQIVSLSQDLPSTVAYSIENLQITKAINEDFPTSNSVKFMHCPVCALRHSWLQVSCPM